MDRAYLKVKDLMTLYRVSDKTVRRWITAGLPCLRFGYNILRFERAVAIHWIENYRVAHSKKKRTA